MRVKWGFEAFFKKDNNRYCGKMGIWINIVNIEYLMVGFVNYEQKDYIYLINLILFN